MRQIIYYLVFLIVLVFALAACERGQEEPLRIGTCVWPGYEPLYLARSLGYFDQKAVNLVDLTSASEVIRAFRNGALEGAVLTLDEAMLLAGSGVEFCVILLMDISHGGDVILGRPGLATIADIKGKRVGVESTALGAYMLTRATEIAGIDMSKLTTVPLEISEHEAAYKLKKVDALVTYEPVRTKLITAGARVLFDSRQIPGEIVDVLVVRRDCLDKHAKEIVKLRHGWFLALDYLHDNPQDAASRMAGRMKVSPAEVLKSYDGLRLAGRDENRNMLGGPRPALRATAEKLVKTMLDRKLLSKQVDVKSLFEERSKQDLK